MKIVAISDTHGKHAKLNLPEGDMIIHAGDVSSGGLISEIKPFLDWYGQLPYKYKVFIVGNHDFLAENNPTIFRKMIPDNLIYLEDSAVTIEGIKIWGSPITPWFYNWAFNRQRGNDIASYWAKIPTDTDILVTHGPAYNVLDKTTRGELTGCKDLLERIDEIKPAFHIFGHIHEAYGVEKLNDTTFINASVLNLQYQLKNEPIVFEFEKK